jgi:hypothetical protein
MWGVMPLATSTTGWTRKIGVQPDKCGLRGMMHTRVITQFLFLSSHCSLIQTRFLECAISESVGKRTSNHELTQPNMHYLLTGESMPPAIHSRTALLTMAVIMAAFVCMPTRQTAQQLTVKTIEYPARGNPTSAAVTADGRFVFVSNLNAIRQNPLPPQCCNSSKPYRPSRRAPGRSLRIP